MKRIQRKRSKGWRMPQNAKYVGRPTQWGNPFRLSPDGYILYFKTGKILGSPWCYWSATSGFTLKDVLDLYGQWLDGKLQKGHPHLPTPPSLEALKGKDLACFCRLNQPCHADMLLQKLISL